MNYTKLFVVLALLFLLVLVGCTRGGVIQGKYRYDTPEYFKGFEGVELEFVEQAPPLTLLEDVPFDVQTIISNNGAYSVVDPQRVEVELVVDSAHVQDVNLQGDEEYIYLYQDDIQLYGRSYYYSNGQEEFFPLDRYTARDIYGNFERNVAEFFATLCYPYRTYFSGLICVDTDVTDIDQRRQVCSQENYKYSKGQGAPVAITAVDSNIVPRGAYVEPQFTIHIEHKGDGIVSLYNTSDPNQYQCGDTGEEIVNKMEIQATLGNDTLECLPNPVFFREGEAVVNCRLPQSSILATAANYYTGLNVELFYIYTESYYREVTVNRKENNVFSLRSIDDGYDECPPWEVYDSAEDICISRCNYCAENPTTVGCEVNDMQLKDLTKPKEFNPYFSCVYDAQDCAKADDGCIRETDRFCPPGVYCGMPACARNKISNHRPRAYLEESTPAGEISWYCQDYDNTGDLIDACGCLDASGYVALMPGKSVCPRNVSVYTEATGTFSRALGRVYFTIDSDAISSGAKGMCVHVADQQGVQVFEKLIFT